MSAESSPPTPEILLHAEFFLGRDEFAQALLAVFRHNGALRKRAIAIWLVSTGVLGAFAAMNDRWRDPTVIGFVVLFGSLYALLYQRRFAKRTVNASLMAMKIDTAPGVIGQRRVQVTSNELLTAGEVTRMASRLDTLQLLREDDMAIVLFPGGMFLPIPRDGNYGRETFATFCDKLQRLIAEAAQARLPRV
ncbi:MAG: hypothetical protein WD875_09310 [Pirellulales bacterium]